MHTARGTIQVGNDIYQDKARSQHSSSTGCQELLENNTKKPKNPESFNEFFVRSPGAGHSPRSPAQPPEPGTAPGARHSPPNRVQHPELGTAPEPGTDPQRPSTDPVNRVQTPGAPGTALELGTAPQPGTAHPSRAQPPEAGTAPMNRLQTPGARHSTQSRAQPPGAPALPHGAPALPLSGAQHTQTGHSPPSPGTDPGAGHRPRSRAHPSSSGSPGEPFRRRAPQGGCRGLEVPPELEVTLRQPLRADPPALPHIGPDPHRSPQSRPPHAPSELPRPPTALGARSVAARHGHHSAG
ncbi:basic proline-rich protein-like [Ammospiza caudacuta]|uniref:basic proline-rich protein-like n=1 Tax=Ammospiza caudacuta TaxID=2857398 RepID=UPI00273984AA|nr:basic proline-rich protein-like [Ammospiza caudacuta]